MLQFRISTSLDSSEAQLDRELDEIVDGEQVAREAELNVESVAVAHQKAWDRVEVIKVPDGCLFQSSADYRHVLLEVAVCQLNHLPPSLGVRCHLAMVNLVQEETWAKLAIKVITGFLDRIELHFTKFVERKDRSDLIVKSGQVFNLLGVLVGEQERGGDRVNDTGAVERELDSLDRQCRKVLPGKHSCVEKIPWTMVRSHNHAVPVCPEDTEKLVDSWSPLWYNLTVEGWSRCSMEALSGGVMREGIYSYGRPLEWNPNTTRQLKIEQEMIEINIKRKVDRAMMINEGRYACFYILQTNMTADGNVMPAELNLAWISLRKWVEEVYHMFIESGTLPKVKLLFSQHETVRM